MAELDALPARARELAQQGEVESGFCAQGGAFGGSVLAKISW